jgi:predicted GIY-YIG superfamily endonuclease
VTAAAIDVDQPHTLYRMFSAAGVLLYVGVTNDAGRRWREHAASKPWWSEVANVTVEHHPNRRSVELAERLAIITERPIHNLIHNAAERRLWAWIEWKVERTGFGDIVMPRSAQRAIIRRHQRLTNTAIAAFLLLGAILIATTWFPAVTGRPVPGQLGAGAALSVYALFAAYCLLRLKARRLSCTATYKRWEATQ